MKLYENIVIGNFLFALGYRIRTKKSVETLNGSVNLLQQTPEDKALGDVLVNLSGIVRLIEFKAQGASMSKEEKRHDRLCQAISKKAAEAEGRQSCLCKAIEGTHLEAVSRDIHWYIESKADEKALRTRIVPYLDAFPRPRGPKVQRLETFVDTLACEVAEGDVRHSKEDVKEYLKLVRLTMGSGAVGSGGLLLVAEPEGGLVFAPMLDLMELDMHHGHWLHHRNNLEQALSQKLEREFKLERHQEYDGPSL
ncbi:MAG: hypothetical protein FWD67_08500 [Betaproteobacteria bacterium]|nr:hypothetical protein [Betaproteobacteria bacterium]